MTYNQTQAVSWLVQRYGGPVVLKESDGSELVTASIGSREWRLDGAGKIVQHRAHATGPASAPDRGAG